DGVFVKRPHFAAIKGVAADEAEHEQGISGIILWMQGRFERMQARRAERVIATSLYSAEHIAHFYGVDSAKIRVVPELIDLSMWESALRAAPVESGPPRVLCVAHLYRDRKSTRLNSS